MKKYVCSVCGYVYEGDSAPEKCPVCGVGAEKFTEVKEGEREWAAEHVVGVAKGVSEDILADLRANFEGECSEVGMYLAMARVAHREGYPEIGLYWEKAAYEEAEHAAKFAELLGEVVTDSPKQQISMQFMTQYTKWPATKPATEKHSKDCLRDTLDKLQAKQKSENNALQVYLHGRLFLLF